MVCEHCTRLAVSPFCSTCYPIAICRIRQCHISLRHSASRKAKIIDACDLSNGLAAIKQRQCKLPQYSSSVPASMPASLPACQTSTVIVCHYLAVVSLWNGMIVHPRARRQVQVRPPLQLLVLFSPIGGIAGLQLAPNHLFALHIYVKVARRSFVDD